MYNLRKLRQKKPKRIEINGEKKNSARHLLIIKFEIERTGSRVAIIDDKCCTIRKIPKNYEREKIVIKNVFGRKQKLFSNEELRKCAIT